MAAPVDATTASQPAPPAAGDKQQSKAAQWFSNARRRMGSRMNLEMPEPDGPRTDEARIRTLREGEKLTDFYTIHEDKMLHDAGVRAKVFLGKDKQSGKEVVIKTRTKGHFGAGGESTWRKILTRILNLEANTHVLGVNVILEDVERYYVVMEKCSGGELFDFLVSETDVPEKECKRIMREILKAVGHLHKNGVIHRDLKPENLLFNDEIQHPIGATSATSPSSAKPRGENLGEMSPKTVKLIDFDTVQEHSPETPKAKRLVGTPGYLAPENLIGEYSFASDLWSVGVIFYILMSGEMPFPDSTFQECCSTNLVGSPKLNAVYERLGRTKIDFSQPPWPDFPGARDLCRQLLTFDPTNRVQSAEDALKHPWLQE